MQAKLQLASVSEYGEWLNHLLKITEKFENLENCCCTCTFMVSRDFPHVLRVWRSLKPGVHDSHVLVELTCNKVLHFDMFFKVCLVGSFLLLVFNLCNFGYGYLHENLA